MAIILTIGWAVVAFVLALVLQSWIPYPVCFFFLLLTIGFVGAKR